LLAASVWPLFRLAGYLEELLPLLSAPITAGGEGRGGAGAAAEERRPRVASRTKQHCQAPQVAADGAGQARGAR
jgi:hypothetical protein